MPSEENELALLRGQVQSLVEKVNRLTYELGVEPGESPPADLGTKTILIVEDDDDSRAILVSVLEHAGYATIEATNGVEALQKLSHVVPNLVLLDIRMPKMDGGALQDRLQANPKLRNVPVVVVSAVSETLGLRVAANADAFFQKPIDLSSLLETLPKLVT